MKSRAKGLEITVNFNIGIKVGSAELHNESYKDVDACCNFDIKFAADEYEDDVNLKELTEALNTLINKSVSEVNEQVREQKITTEQDTTTTKAVKENTPAESEKEPYSDDIDGDDIANAMC